MTIDVAAILNELYKVDPDNHLDDAAGTLLYDPPLIGVADAADPWFTRFKEVIGPHHRTPDEALARVAPGVHARSVICWSLPLADLPRKSMRKETRIPSREWAYARTMADRIMRRMEGGLIARLHAAGFVGVAPASIPNNDVETQTQPKLSSCWSQRHVAFVAGLGTFGISSGLITERGIAQRLSSIVTDAVVPPTPRPYGDDPFAYCLRMSQGTCGACIPRCPVGSIGKTVHERKKDVCYAHRNMIRERGLELYGWGGARYGCGLCQIAVPCESVNPTARAKRSKR